MINLQGRLIFRALLLLGLCLPACAGAQQAGAAKSNIARTGPVPGVGPTGSMYEGNNTVLTDRPTPPDLVAGSSSGASSVPAGLRASAAGRPGQSGPDPSKNGAPGNPGSGAPTDLSSTMGASSASGGAGANSATGMGGAGMSGGGNQSGGEH